MFTLIFDDKFITVYDAKIQGNLKLEKAVQKTFHLLEIDPKYRSLKTHKVDTKNHDNVFSSRITGDWRIIWAFDEPSKTATIICLELGTHGGANQVYKRKSN
jgi:mRNA-degrading endonuclease YafQ of YafQ-DinJ toxin-antitoxin module